VTHFCKFGTPDDCWTVFEAKLSISRQKTKTSLEDVVKSAENTWTTPTKEQDYANVEADVEILSTPGPYVIKLFYDV
jgi:hypothetical protein